MDKRESLGLAKVIALQLGNDIWMQCTGVQKVNQIVVKWCLRVLTARLFRKVYQEGTLVVTVSASKQVTTCKE